MARLAGRRGWGGSRPPKSEESSVSELFGSPNDPERTLSGAMRPADANRRALRFCALFAGILAIGAVRPAPRPGNSLHPIRPMSEPPRADSLSVSLNLVDVAHLVNKISVIAGQGLTTTAFSVVRFPPGQRNHPVKPGASRSRCPDRHDGPEMWRAFSRGREGVCGLGDDEATAARSPGTPAARPRAQEGSA